MSATSTIVSWNVNGIRAAAKKGLVDWIDREQAQIVCLQETKARPEQVSEELQSPAGYRAYWRSAERKGYSGVVTYSMIEPINEFDLDSEQFDAEGRVCGLEFEDFFLLNAYFPNSRGEGERLDYKLEFCDAMLGLCRRLRDSGKGVVLCGDYNIAHKPIDLARPKQNEKHAGYLPEEREWLDTFASDGWVDTFRMFESEGGWYTWWSYRSGARPKNIGWRLDYFWVNEAFRSHIYCSEILSSVTGSDHCPVRLQMTFR